MINALGRHVVDVIPSGENIIHARKRTVRTFPFVIPSIFVDHEFFSVRCGGISCFTSRAVFNFGRELNIEGKLFLQLFEREGIILAENSLKDFVGSGESFGGEHDFLSCF